MTINASKTGSPSTQCKPATWPPPESLRFDPKRTKAIKILLKEKRDHSSVNVKFPPLNSRHG